MTRHRKEKWTALYLPARPPGRPDPSKFDCASRDEAQEWVFTHMCGMCKEERARVLDGQGREHESDYPPCTCEWLILKTKDYQKSEDLGDMMEAAGFKTIYKRPA